MSQCMNCPPKKWSLSRGGHWGEVIVKEVQLYVNEPLVRAKMLTRRRVQGGGSSLVCQSFFFMAVEESLFRQLECTLRAVTGATID